MRIKYFLGLDNKEFVITVYFFRCVLVRGGYCYKK